MALFTEVMLGQFFVTAQLDNHVPLTIRRLFYGTCKVVKLHNYEGEVLSLPKWHEIEYPCIPSDNLLLMIIIFYMKLFRIDTLKVKVSLTIFVYSPPQNVSVRPSCGSWLCIA